MMVRVWKMVLAVVMVMGLTFGCNKVVTVYWEKPGAGNEELQRDKAECEALQRAVGLNEERIEKCLEAQGWSFVKQEVGTKSIDSGLPKEGS